MVVCGLLLARVELVTAFWHFPLYGKLLLTLIIVIEFGQEVLCGKQGLGVSHFLALLHRCSYGKLD